LEWATDQSFEMSRSLKIVKSVTDTLAMWTSENMVDNWTPKLNALEQYMLGAWVKTEGINTLPLNVDEQWMIKYSFYDQSDVLIGAVTIDIDQTAATADWVEVKDSVILPFDAYTVIIDLIGGKDATGTVWADKFQRAWNKTMELPTGWFNWFPETGGAVSHGYENTRITTEESHTGLHSLKFDLPFGRPAQDAFVGSRRILLDGSSPPASRMVIENNTSSISGVNPGDWLRISVWIKAMNLVPDSAAKYPNSWAVGFTPLMFEGAGNNDGYDDIKTFGPDLYFKFPPVTSFDWTEYYEDVQIPEDGGLTKAIEVRIHPYSTFTGTIYFDDLSIKVILKPTGVGEENDIPMSYELSQNYPNPFNPSTTIKYAIPQQSLVKIKVYDILGREVKTLVNVERSPGIYSVQWNGDNNYGSKVASGIYIYRVVAGTFIQVKKMILLK
jgi:hypothetical protein